MISMEQIHTVVCQLSPTPDQCTQLANTCERFAEACTYVHETLAPALRNKDRMQALIYFDVRERFGLSANLAIQAIRRVAGARKSAQALGSTVEAFAPTSVPYDARIFSFRERDWTVSLTVLHGRERLSMRLGDYQREKLHGQKPKAATLCQQPDGTYALHIQLHSTPPVPDEPIDVLGVDLGRIDIAHTSDDQTWSGRQLTDIRDHNTHLRGVLQYKASKGTRSTRRRCRQLLARLSGRERRFQRHTNHGISKALVAQASARTSALALEDLTGIRARTNQQPRPKAERRRGNSWAFFQLRQFVAYKAQAAGVILHLVPAAYTSQMCHVCLHLGQRRGKHFACTNQACHWTGDSDLNGARNIRILGLQVSQARGPWVHSLWSGAPAGLQKAAAL